MGEILNVKELIDKDEVNRAKGLPKGSPFKGIVS